MNILFCLLGLVGGSFLNLCIDRLPRRESIIRPPSHCDGCGHRLGFIDLIPVIGYLYLRGRCRYCGASISPRVPMVEVGIGLLFVVLWNHYGLSVELLAAMVLTSLFIVISVIDIDHHLILNRLVYPAIALAFLVGILTPSHGIISAIAGGAIGAGILLPLAIISPGSMGMGDVKLAVLIGLLVGFPYVFFALLVAFILGGFVGVGMLLAKLKGRKDPVETLVMPLEYRCSTGKE
ncbi:prepilin peptidase [Chloroflexota bacterium]